jgi:general L-amino acid transport system permease protein
MTVHVIDPAVEHMQPPAASVGVLGWIRANLFNGVFNSILTVLTLVLLWQTVPPLVQWALIDAHWVGGGDACRSDGGACWSVVSSNLRFIVFGFYPHPEQWRPLVAMLLLVGLLFYSQDRARWGRFLAWAWLVGLVAMGVLLKGGILGLVAVESTQWGGLPLTMLLSVFGLTAAYPLGVVLALGRQSPMRVIKALCVVYIELIRGVPLISLLFMSSVVFPLFLPEGVTVNKILRAQVAIILFTAAYIAEVVRGGLQAIPRGQYEAAESMGLNYWQTMRLVVLPQALKIVIPPSVSILISAFKDTSLVVIIALYDLLKTTKSVLSDPKWMGFSAEAYIFVALIYFVCCYFMSNYSRRLERELDTGL